MKKSITYTSPYKAEPIKLWAVRKTYANNGNLAITLFCKDEEYGGIEPYIFLSTNFEEKCKDNVIYVNFNSMDGTEKKIIQWLENKELAVCTFNFKRSGFCEYYEYVLTQDFFNDYCYETVDELVNDLEKENTKMDIIKELEARIEGATVTEVTITKENDVKRIGYQVKVADSNISPTLYVDPDMEVDIDALVRQYHTSMQNAPSIDFLNKSFDELKNDLFVKICNKENSSEMLKNLVYEEFLDLAIIPCIMISQGEMGCASVKITKELANMIGASEEEILEVAKANGEYEFQSMFDILTEGCNPEIPEEIVINPSTNLMIVATNKTKLNGAACIADVEFLKTCPFEDNFFILPSSIHEIICVVEDNVDDELEIFKDMVRDVNDTQVEPNERLSYNVYYFDRETNTVSIAE